MGPAQPPAVIHHLISAGAITTLLTKKSDGQLRRRRKTEPGRTGTRSPRCSGILSFQRSPIRVQVRYVHDEGDTEEISRSVDATRHVQIRRILRAAGYTAEIPDSPLPGDHGVDVRRLSVPTDSEWDALDLIAAGQVTHERGSAVSGVAHDLFLRIAYSGLAIVTRETARTGAAYVRLTEQGESLITTRFTQRTSLTDQLEVPLPGL